VDGGDGCEPGWRRGASRTGLGWGGPGAGRGASRDGTRAGPGRGASRVARSEVGAPPASRHPGFRGRAWCPAGPGVFVMRRTAILPLGQNSSKRCRARTTTPRRRTTCAEQRPSPSGRGPGEPLTAVTIAECYPTAATTLAVAGRPRSGAGRGARAKAVAPAGDPGRGSRVVTHESVGIGARRARPGSSACNRASSAGSPGTTTAVPWGRVVQPPQLPRSPGSLCIYVAFKTCLRRVRVAERRRGGSRRRSGWLGGWLRAGYWWPAAARLGLVFVPVGGRGRHREWPAGPGRLGSAGGPGTECSVSSGRAGGRGRPGAPGAWRGGRTPHGALAARAGCAGRATRI
jgi:hypothetical protein